MIRPDVNEAPVASVGSSPSSSSGGRYGGPLVAVLVVLLVLVMILEPREPASAAQDGGKIAWSRDPQAALLEAGTSGKPMMYFFTSDG